MVYLASTALFISHRQYNIQYFNPLNVARLPFHPSYTAQHIQLYLPEEPKTNFFLID